MNLKNYRMVSLQWMREVFNKLNRDVFDNYLPLIHLHTNNIISGGSMGETVGVFSMNRMSVGTDDNGMMFLYGISPKVYINRWNFCILSPTIGVNGNYLWTQYVLESVMLHEMCHYRAHVDGHDFERNKHGDLFIKWARIADERTNWKYGISKLTFYTPGLKMGNRMREYWEKSWNRSKVLLMFHDNGDVLLKHSSREAIDNIVKNDNECTKIISSEDNKLKEWLFLHGYQRVNSNAEKYSFHVNEDKDIIKQFNSQKFDTKIEKNIL